MNDNLPELQENSKHSIEQIRDLIFGEQITEYKNMIANLTQECSSLKKRLDALEKKYQDDLEQVNTDNSAKHSESESKQQELVEFVRKITEEFDQKIEKLAEQKVDKSEIGQAFIDWGMKVKKQQF